MPYRSKDVKRNTITLALLAALVSVTMLSGCKRVSEDISVTELVYISETVSAETQIMSETETEPAEHTETVSVSEKEVVLSETTLQTTSESTAAENTETVTESVTESETVPFTAKNALTEAEVTEAESFEKDDAEIIITQEKTETAVQTEEAAVTTQTTTVKETDFTMVLSETTVQTAVTQAEAPSVYGNNFYTALNYNEQKGVWISYLEYDRIMKNKSEESFRKEIQECFDNIADIGFNTVYVQVRAYGDAYYESKLFPSGDRFNGTMGTSEDYDALEIMINEAHRRGMSVHAWINPMRLMTDAQIESLSDGFRIKQWYDDPSTNGKYIVKYSGRWYLNPAYSQVIQLIADGITEIVANYDVDGVQIDDYFYPTTEKSFDSSAYSGSGTELSLSDWRIQNVNAMVKKLYSAVHNANPSAVFGISPQGSIDNNYNHMYADVRRWCSEYGYCDYMLPQIYFGFDNSTLPYCDTVTAWDKLVKNNVKLVVGLAAYKSGTEDTYAGEGGKNEWINNSDVLARQIRFAAEAGNYGGVAVFRYDSLFEPGASVSEQVSLELENIKKMSRF